MPGALTHRLALSGHIIRRPGVIEIEYRIAGWMAGKMLLENAGRPERRHELWRQTCFELFFGIQGDSAYWEVNLSPNGDWNIYRFTDYRTGMREELLAVQPVCVVVGEGGLFSLCCTLDCKALTDDSSDLELAVSCIIKDTGGSLSYWAVDHCGAEPDFHDRANFRMVLPGVKGSKNAI